MSEELSQEQLLSKILEAPDGELKVASEVTSGIIKRKIRENGFARAVIPPKTVGRSDLATLPNTEMPVIVEEMENETYGARTVSFNDSPDAATFRGVKFVVYFFTINSREYTKNVYELMTYKNDFRQITVDNALREMQREEDVQFLGLVDDIVGTEATADGDAGYEQNHTINVTDPEVISRVDYAKSTSYLEDHDLNNGLFLMNRRSSKWFLNFDRTEIGGDLSQDIFRDGVEAIQNFKIFGYRHASTIKRDLVPNYVVYQFAEPSYTGRFYVLQDTTMYVKKERDMLRFSATEKIGMAIPNVAACHRLRFL